MAPIGVFRLDPPPHEISQRQHGDDNEQADPDMRRAPARRRDEMLHHRRPHRAGEIIAGGGERDRDAAPAHEPMRHLGHQRAESGRAAEADQQAIGEASPATASRRARPPHSRASSANCAERQRHGDAEAVGELAHHHAAGGEAEHGEACRAGKRRRGRRRNRPGSQEAPPPPTTCRRRRSCSAARPRLAESRRLPNRSGPAWPDLRFFVWKSRDELPGYGTRKALVAS